MKSNADLLKEAREKKRKSASDKATPTIAGELLKRVLEVKHSENLKSTKAAVELLIEMGLNAYDQESSDPQAAGQPRLHKAG